MGRLTADEVTEVLIHALHAASPEVARILRTHARRIPLPKQLATYLLQDVYADLWEVFMRTVVEQLAELERID